MEPFTLIVMLLFFIPKKVMRNNKANYESASFMSNYNIQYSAIPIEVYKEENGKDKFVKKVFPVWFKHRRDNRKFLYDIFKKYGYSNKAIRVLIGWSQHAGRFFLNPTKTRKPMRGFNFMGGKAGKSFRKAGHFYFVAPTKERNRKTDTYYDAGKHKWIYYDSPFDYMEKYWLRLMRGRYVSANNILKSNRITVTKVATELEKHGYFTGRLESFIRDVESGYRTCINDLKYFDIDLTKWR